MGAAWRGRDPGVVIFFGALCMWLLGSTGVEGQCLGLSGWGVDWALSVSYTASFGGTWGWFLGGVLHGWGLLWRDRGVCVLLPMVQAIHRLWDFGALGLLKPLTSTCVSVFFWFLGLCGFWTACAVAVVCVSFFSVLGLFSVVWSIFLGGRC